MEFHTYVKKEKALVEEKIPLPSCIGLHEYAKPWKKVANSGGSRNFKTGGRGPGAVEFLGLGFVLMPLPTYSMCL